MPDIVKQNEAALEFQRPPTPSITDIIAQAVQSGRPASELTELLAFARQLDADKARKEFAAAMAEFKRTCPKIRRRTENPQFKVTRNGTTSAKLYASLSDIGAAIDGPLSAVGLSYDWTDSVVEGETMKLGCIVRHSGGHVAEPKYTSFPTGSQAGSSPQQKHASTMEYCRRYSLKNALGLTDCDDDDTDGNDESPTISQEQANDMNDRLIDCNADVTAFKRLYGIERLTDLPVAKLSDALARIDAKKKAKKP